MDALATDKFYLEDMIKQFQSDTRATSRNNKNIVTEVSVGVYFNFLAISSLTIFMITLII